MPTVHISIFRQGGGAGNGAPMPTIASHELAAETIVSGPASQSSAIEAPEAGQTFWQVIPNGDIFVKFGRAPVAAPGTGFLLLKGMVGEFAVSGMGEKIAVVDAALA